MHWKYLQMPTHLRRTSARRIQISRARTTIAPKTRILIPHHRRKTFQSLFGRVSRARSNSGSFSLVHMPVCSQLRTFCELMGFSQTTSVSLTLWSRACLWYSASQFHLSIYHFVSIVVLSILFSFLALVALFYTIPQRQWNNLLLWLRALVVIEWSLSFRCPRYWAMLTNFACSHTDHGFSILIQRVRWKRSSLSLSCIVV